MPRLALPVGSKQTIHLIRNVSRSQERGLKIDTSRFPPWPTSGGARRRPRRSRAACGCTGAAPAAALRSRSPAPCRKPRRPPRAFSPCYRAANSPPRPRRPHTRRFERRRFIRGSRAYLRHSRATTAATPPAEGQRRRRGRRARSVPSRDSPLTSAVFH